MKSLLPQAFAVSNVHPRPRKRLARCTLDCGFKTSESPALRGFVAERAPIRGTSLYLVLKSNGLHCPKIRLKKFGFSPKTIPTNIAKKLPPQRCSKPLFIAFFNFSHKWPTFAFAGESGYTLGFRRKIAHGGLHAETGVFPPSVTAQSCAASKIALNTVFATLDSATLLYTYISRFSVNPHYQQQFYLRPSFIAFFNFSHKRPTFAFTGESGYTLGFRRKVAHTPKQVAFRMGVVSLPSERSACSQTSPARVSERQTLPLLGLGLVCARRTQKACGTAMRFYARRCSEASQSRWAALPAASMHSACFSGMERLDQAFRQSYYHTQLTERAAVWRLCGNRFGR